MFTTTIRNNGRTIRHTLNQADTARLQALLIDLGMQHWIREAK